MCKGVWHYLWVFRVFWHLKKYISCHGSFNNWASPNYYVSECSKLTQGQAGWSQQAGAGLSWFGSDPKSKFELSSGWACLVLKTWRFKGWARLRLGAGCENFELYPIIESLINIVKKNYVVQVFLMFTNLWNRFTGLLYSALKWHHIFKLVIYFSFSWHFQFTESFYAVKLFSLFTAQDR